MLVKPAHLTHLWLIVDGKELKGFFAGTKYFSLSGHEVNPESWKKRSWRKTNEK